ncbi:MAG: hypothetical protein K8R07_08640 [Desulfobacterales bacterium]|nr:hypothetical protein [Desulfobacterales bacterium]
MYKFADFVVNILVNFTVSFGSTFQSFKQKVCEDSMSAAQMRVFYR